MTRPLRIIIAGGDSGRNLALLIVRKLGRCICPSTGQEIGVSESAVAHVVAQAERLISEDAREMKFFMAAAEYSSFKA